MTKPPPFTPPYFGFIETSHGIVIYRPGREVAGIVDSFDEYLAFVRFHTERAQERHDKATAALDRIAELNPETMIDSLPPTLNLRIDL
jgi:hypothetical protein